MSNKEQILTVTTKITRLQDQLKTIDKEIDALNTFKGVGHLGVGLMGSAIGHISFGQLLERYEDVLLEPLVQLKTEERLNLEVFLDEAIESLSELFEKEVDIEPTGENEDFWYPNTPNLKWIERNNLYSKPYGLENTDLVEVLTELDREQKDWFSDPRSAEYWSWDTGTIVAFAIVK